MKVRTKNLLKKNLGLVLGTSFGAVLLSSCINTMSISSIFSSKKEAENSPKKELTLQSISSEEFYNDEVYPIELNPTSQSIKEHLSQDLASIERAKPSRALSRRAKINKILAKAKSFSGTRYRMGGTGEKGIDCSGLMLMSYKAIGFLLPRTSRDQSEFGTEVKKEDLQPGDLVFFKRRRGKVISHVGMVSDVSNGKVTFIHSASRRGVVEDDLNSKYYANGFVKAVRPF